MRKCTLKKGRTGVECRGGESRLTDIESPAGTEPWAETPAWGPCELWAQRAGSGGRISRL